MHKPLSFDPIGCKLAFPVSEAISDKQADVKRLRTLCTSAKIATEENADAADILAEIAKNLAAAELSARSLIGWEVGEKYVQPMRKLRAANSQAVYDTAHGGFLTWLERDLVYGPDTDTDHILEMWQDDEIREADAALLTKYTVAIAAPVHDVTPGRIWRDRDGDDEVGIVWDYKDVIRAAREANTTQEVSA